MRRNSFRFPCVLFCVALILTSCALFENAPEIVPDAAMRSRLATLKHWRMDGRVGVRRADESWHAGLIWNHEPDTDRLYLSGPFGQGALNIKVTRHSIRVASADGTVEESDDPARMLESLIGVAVPVSALRYWILGLSYPDAECGCEYDRSGRLKKLNQLGWVTEYQDYQTVEQWSVPKKLSVENASTRLKLVIDEWRFRDANITTQAGS